MFYGHSLKDFDEESKEDILNIRCLFEDFGYHSPKTLVDCELCAIDKNLLKSLLKRKPKTGIFFLEFMKKSWFVPIKSKRNGDKKCSFPNNILHPRSL